MLYEKDLELALDVARRAGDLAMHYFDRTTETDEKADLSPITIADRECERLIGKLLEEGFPEDGILAEEGLSRPSGSGRRWIVDPIDGTRDFVRRTPFWAVQIALQVEGRIVLGVIHLPYWKDTLFAVEEGGCFWNDSRTRASSLSRMDKAVLTISGFKSAWDAWSAEQIRYLTRSCWTVRAFSGCYDITMIARGKVDIWLSGNGMEWDYAPARIIAEECGAKFLTKDNSGRIDLDHCVICAPGLENEIRRVLNIPSNLRG
jgi:fructose-1,6-bisphosphatase/inositol monophosphatase family enzyme